MSECDLDVRVTPRSSRNKIEVQEGAVKVWVTASPTDGQANDAVGRALAHALGIAPSRVTLVRGATSREKRFRLDGVSHAEAMAKLSPDTGST